tara:strand:- start:55244 stop:55711 length:468 start_codon:yes stop_codon:yes gene_type:complete
MDIHSELAARYVAERKMSIINDALETVYFATESKEELHKRVQVRRTSSTAEMVSIDGLDLIHFLLDEYEVDDDNDDIIYLGVTIQAIRFDSGDPRMNSTVAWDGIVKCSKCGSEFRTETEVEGICPYPILPVECDNCNELSAYYDPKKESTSESN